MHCLGANEGDRRPCISAQLIYPNSQRVQNNVQPATEIVKEINDQASLILNQLSTMSV